jgi:hypothetical protein
MHDSGPGWFATPFPYDSFIHNSTPVYPGALNALRKGGCFPLVPPAGGDYRAVIEIRALIMERLADSETGTGITRTRDAVRGSSTAFALLTPVKMTNGLLIVDAICVTGD